MIELNKILINITLFVFIMKIDEMFSLLSIIHCSQIIIFL